MKNYEQSLDMTFRKDEGIFYSPNVITKFIVNYVLDNYLVFFQATTLFEFRELKILDPACGSGAFLLEIFDYLWNFYTKKFPNENTQTIKNHIIEYNLYGIDLDKNALEICKKLLFEISHSYSQNILFGNSLISDKQIDERAFDWTIFSFKFDIVIGNPPYFSLSTQESDFLAYYEQHFEVFEKTSDIYCLFYEKSLKMLKPKGFLGYITSNQWLQTNYGKILREYFVKNANPKLLVNFGGVKVFKDATVDSAIMILRKETCNHQLTASQLPNNFEVEKQEIKEFVEKNEILLQKLHKERWIIAQDEALELREKIYNIGSFLKDWNIKIFRGLLTGLDAAFMINESTRNELIHKDSKNADIIVPILRGRDVHSFYVEYQNLYLILTKNGIDIKKYPSVLKYLENFGNAIKNRSDKGENWWNLRACSYYEDFKKPKIIYPETTVRRNEFYLDKNGFYLNKTCFMIVGEDLEFLSGVLTSSLIEWYLEKELRSLGKKSIQYSKQYMENLPLPKKENMNILLYEKIKSLSEQLSEDKKVGNETDFEFHKKELNEAVLELYGIEKMQFKKFLNL